MTINASDAHEIKELVEESFDAECCLVCAAWLQPDVAYRVVCDMELSADDFGDPRAAAILYYVSVCGDLGEDPTIAGCLGFAGEYGIDDHVLDELLLWPLRWQDQRGRVLIRERCIIEFAEQVRSLARTRLWWQTRRRRPHPEQEQDVYQSLRKDAENARTKRRIPNRTTRGRSRIDRIHTAH